MVALAGLDAGSDIEAGAIPLAISWDGAEEREEGWAAGSVVGAEPESTSISLEPDREGEANGVVTKEPEDSGSGATA